MSGIMNHLEKKLVLDLRGMARRGDSVGTMFREVKKRVGPDIVSILEYMRSAFCLSLVEAKPIAALSRTDGRELEDELQLHQSVMPMIEKHRDEWDN
jgi:hypothetical protein